MQTTGQNKHNFIPSNTTLLYAKYVELADVLDYSSCEQLCIVVLLTVKS